MQAIFEQMTATLAQNGYRAQAVAAQKLYDLRAELETLRAAGRIDNAFYENSLTHFDFDATEKLAGAKAVIIVAIPQPIVQLAVCWQGQTRHVTLPPTYADPQDDEPETLLTALLASRGHRLQRINPPLKLLAVHSGLSEYGRNNVTYTADMGSFYRLAAWATDLPLDGGVWREPRRMAVCDHCRRCVAACPTRCIRVERKLVRAEICLTHINETATPFPAWVQRSWHNALVGCMACQASCPQNRPYLEPHLWPEPLSEADVTLLIAAPPVETLPTPLQATLAKLGLTDYHGASLLGRNLLALLEQA